MIRSLKTLIYGLGIAVLVMLVAVAATLYVIGLTAKAVLFGDPRMTLFAKIIERANRKEKTNPPDITNLTPNTGGE